MPADGSAIETLDVWRKYEELNSLKTALADRNEELAVEIQAFKTHFSKYEAQDHLKQRGETFQSGLFKELTALRDERDLLRWQLEARGGGGRERDTFELRRKLVEARNEVVRLRVKQDMEEYNALILGVSPFKAKRVEDPEAEKRVREYVEDLTAMREQLLRVEFRNIALEDAQNKRDIEVFNLNVKMRELTEALEAAQ